MNENIKKFEYYIFIKKIKEKIYVKNQIKTNIILFQERLALDQLLTNVIFKMKKDILNEKIKRFLIKKFIYKVMNQYIENYKKETVEKNSSLDLIESQNKIFNSFRIKLYSFTFLKKIKICINNTKLKNVQENIMIEKRNNYLKKYLQEIKKFVSYDYSKETKIFFQKLFFKRIKNIILHKSNEINYISSLNNTKRLFIFKINFSLFLNNCKSHNTKINKISFIKQKFDKYKEIEIKTKEMKKYFKKFINRVRIKKQTNDSLKRKIFNIIKKNVIISKELKYYLNEAKEIK